MGPRLPPRTTCLLQLTSFVGREREIADLRKLLVGEARLVTLTGPGGSGKTRLALAVASGLVEAFKDGGMRGSPLSVSPDRRYIETTHHN